MSKKSNQDVLNRNDIKRVPKKRSKYQWQAILWLIVPFALLIAFCYYPPIKAFLDSFYDTGIVKGKTTTYFVGFQNYKSILSDKVFWLCMKNVAIFMVVGLICGNFMTIFLAELLFNLKSKKLGGVFRVLFILPILVPGLVIMLIWKYLIFGDLGLMHQLGITFGVNNPQWYWDTEHDFIAKFAIIMTNFPWVGGTSFLIYLAGFQSISKSVMEASKMDNCSVWKRITKIDLPLIASTMKYFLVMGVIGGFQNFDLQLIVVGMETDPTMTLGLYLYDRAFGVGYIDETRIITQRFGYASAVGMIILVLTLALSIINMSLNTDKPEKKAKIKSYSYKQYLKEMKKNENSL